ncbi:MULTISPECIES: CoA-acylating methylmalonate-semialdehyde dehydrogenase [unclassified Pseudomonas]|jgi:malonate-semialdehyde dehydrogenase (acetylating)/methylmalonate-semialdehyde dehydrogenase|uniref:CoA-acylating methylmalonate-semialdehyde dehydrogenase n=1 Tax=unclassified Pseudomonas TaxID=196821 RepID=UPI000C87DA32|nr:MULTISPECIES: CoA-acylating methylmalonate-semialdehyde dehydrogenase [unclassified Pseudomonas]PMU08759.1 methylmalonate-semialdehyde dehydrogenase (CoA acylating) [Pseudomonas sp. FW305-20]PMU16523.1 methylmalonate-semialdehyde dehydrogenase (CoA acylating) [Pseudomonas sp. FW305-122]PMU40790.1 methylmalonate-semialdehyde dehydrogenase (CoA acylating) [Pseudomonas sp. FW305-47B]PMX58429.1 methylmalonate-semialdehyde dehydrogenase (CoA acylating) [Pseudomonas sp. FW305-33]PMX66727.1 methyl
MSNAPIIGHYIHGQVQDINSERFSNVFNPATGSIQARVGLASQKTVDEAVASALKAFPAWSEQSSLRRSRVMFKFKELLDQHHDELAEIISREHGKVFSDAKGEVTRGIEIVEYACGAPNLLKTEFSDNIGGGIDNWNLRQPLGVCAGVTPFNFPVMVPLWMIPLALITGNCFILKPSERDPSASVLMARLLSEAGLPDGVFNVVQGDKTAVDALLQHPDIEAISFVGSTPIAEYIHQQATSRGKRVQALGGAKNHMIVMPDADLDQAADALIGAAYGSAGERCMAISIAVAVGDVGDQLIAKLLPRIDQLKVGNGLKGDSDMGPLVTAEHKAKVEGFIDEGVAQGAQLIVDGRNFKVPGAENGFFVGATLFDNVTTEMSIYQQEIFGPVLGIVRVPDFASAVALINAHEFGNGVSCFTRDGGIARAFARTIKVGMVGINVPIPVPMAWHSFGGWKRSLFGDHHAYGEEGIRFYSRYKSVMQRWPDSIAKGPEFSMPTAN